MESHPVRRLAELGQSIWYDFIRRDLIANGTLAGWIEKDGLRGMTSNPTIFQKAIAGGELYDADIRAAAEATPSPQANFEKLAIADVRGACDAFRPVYDRTDALDGYVSLEVAPDLASDTAATTADAERLWRAVDRPNLMIKIPGTSAGLPAITATLAKGINVNVTLLFAIARYEQVIDAFFAGLEQRLAAGGRVDRLASVASFFVSRVDTAVDAKLKANGSADAKALIGKLAIANARLAYQLFLRKSASPRWQKLVAAGARPQRPLWASTSTKDPSYPDVYYVEALVAKDSVNTVPPETFEAYKDHGRPALRIEDDLPAAQAAFDALARLGIDLGAVTTELEVDGVAKFKASYDALLEAVKAKAEALTVGR